MTMRCICCKHLWKSTTCKSHVQDVQDYNGVDRECGTQHWISNVQESSRYGYYNHLGLACGKAHVGGCDAAWTLREAWLWLKIYNRNCWNNRICLCKNLPVDIMLEKGWGCEGGIKQWLDSKAMSSFNIMNSLNFWLHFKWYCFPLT